MRKVSIEHRKATKAKAAAKWKETHREQYRAYQKAYQVKRRAENPIALLSHRIRVNLENALFHNKNKTYEMILFASKRQEGTEVDHVISPMLFFAFDLKIPSYVVNSYHNLRWIVPTTNKKRGVVIDDEVLKLAEELEKKHDLYLNGFVNFLKDIRDIVNKSQTIIGLERKHAI